MQMETIHLRPFFFWWPGGSHSEIQAMATPLSTETPVPRPKLTTEEFAARIRVDAQTVRAGYSRNGYYQNIVPLKLPNGQLLWDADDVDRLLDGGFSIVSASPEAEELGRDCGQVLIENLLACTAKEAAIPLIADFLVALGDERTRKFRQGAAIGAAEVLANALITGLSVLQKTAVS